MKSGKPHRKKVDPIESPCRKTIYNSYAEAQEAIKYFRENKYVRNLSAYKCNICGMWHLTSKN